MPQRACALVVVLALLAGMALPGTGPRSSCATCPPGCPMHAKRLGCHHAGKVGCHKVPPTSGIRSACHTQDPASEAGSAVRGILPVALNPSPPVDARRAEPSLPAVAMAPLPGLDRATEILRRVS